MEAILNEKTPKCNSHQSCSSDFRSLSNNKISWIPEKAFKLLKILHEDRIAGLEFSQRSCREYAWRLNTSTKTISRLFFYLEQLGFTLSQSKQGRAFSKRWITWEGFQWLESKLTRQMSHQILAIPYIDLSKREKIKNKIIKREIFCGKLAQKFNEDLNLNLEERLDRLLIRKNAPPEQKEQIICKLVASKIGYNRSEQLIGRVAYVDKRKPIADLERYLDACIFHEQRESRSLNA